MTFEVDPLGAFDLATQSQYFGGRPAPADDPRAVVMAFPVEGWRSSAAVVVRQFAGGPVRGEVAGAGRDAAAAWGQAVEVLSLDVDGRDFAAVGARDPVIGNLQARYPSVRPVLFHSPYEAAANFIIGQRISIRQARATRHAMAHLEGDEITAAGESVHAFPRPRILAELTSFPGLSEEKMRRLNGVARSALEGTLDRARLRSLPVEQALEELRAIHGVGPFSAQGILFRGAGVTDEVTDDEMTSRAVQHAYQLASPPDREELLALAENWRPFRMWAVVLLHIWYRREGGGGSSRQ